MLECLILERLPIVVQQIFRLMAERRSIADLLNQPWGGGVVGDSEVLDLAAAMADYQQDIQWLEFESGHNSKVHSPDTLDVIAQECLPRLYLFLCWSFARFTYISGNCVRRRRIDNSKFN